MDMADAASLLPLFLEPNFLPMKNPNLDRILAKRYQLRELIGSGSMGQVYRAEDLLLGGVPVAIKFLSLSTLNQKIRMQERFEQEAKTCALLGQKSIHIVRVMDYGVDDNGTPFYVMEYLKGTSLNDVIRSQTFSLVRFLNLARHICLGLQCAHQGIAIDGKNYPIVHRDIKPSNVLLVQDPSFGELAKILDFGIAKLLQADGSQTNYYMGTFAYSSPEQMEGNELDNRSDIYSLGVMLFEMLSGTIPVQADTDSFGSWYKAHHLQPPRSFDAVNSKFPVPPQIKELVMSCLAKAPSDRPQNVGEIIQVLASLEQAASPLPSSIQQSSTDPISVTTRDNQVKQSFSTDTLCRAISWPKNKPIADICFPHPIQINDEEMAALWVMLPQSGIGQLILSRCYNQFLFIPSPHPMMLWVTVLYHHTYGPKWLPYYLDLKNSQSIEIVQLMVKTGFYRVLLFARESPQQASACLLLNIAPTQRQLLQQWFLLSQSVTASAGSQFSKSLLKQEYEKLKPQVLSKLNAS